MPAAQHFTAADGQKPLVLSSGSSAAAALCRKPSVGTQPKAYLSVFKIEVHKVGKGCFEFERGISSLRGDKRAKTALGWE